MITISTGDLTGMLSDVIPFALDADELPHLQCVHLYWDGRMLHAQATDTRRIAWASWHPDDEPLGKHQDDLFTEFGGADDPWSILLPLAGAAELVKVYKLTWKHQRSPLVVDVLDNRCTVVRTSMTGHTAITTVVEARQLEYPWPDVEGVLASADVIGAATGVAYNSGGLADFAHVRGDTTHLRFTGPEGQALTHITKGNRFVGALIPVKDDEDQP